MRASEERSGDPWRRFALVFSGLAVGFEVAYFALVLGSPLFDRYLELLAGSSGSLLEALGQPVVVSGTELRSAGFAVRVGDGCDAIQLCSLWTAAVIAFPTAASRRLRAVAWGIASLQGLNFVRIGSLVLIGMYLSDAFTIFHRALWPGLLLAITIAGWVVWALWESRRESERAHLG